MVKQISWRSLTCSLHDVRLDITLTCGQSFRWKETQPTEWTSVLNNKVWTLKQTETKILYRIHESDDICNDGPKSDKTKSNKRRKILKDDSIQAECISDHSDDKISCTELDYESVLRDYLQLDIDLTKLYKSWSLADKNFEKIASTFNGVRMLRQDPTENLISFICSSNNNISRISSMVDKLCTNFGVKILDLNGNGYYAFPTLESLSDKSVEQKLKTLGFGYRARYIQQTAEYITKNCPRDWLHNLRNVPYEEARSNLIKLSGIGPKVADCICLMSLDKHQAVPVDTHVWQFTCRDYLPHLKKYKSLTDKTHKEIGDFFRNLYGDYAGWATSVLFSADLKKFKDISKADISS